MIGKETVNEHLGETEQATIRDSLENTKQYKIGRKQNEKEELLELLTTANQQDYFKIINTASPLQFNLMVDGIFSDIAYQIDKLEQDHVESDNPTLNLYIELNKKIIEILDYYRK